MNDWLPLAKEVPLFVVTLFMLIRLVPAVERLSRNVGEMKVMLKTFILRDMGDTEIKKP